MNRLIAACALALLPVVAHGATITSNFANTVVFGDSLSDPGNTPLGQFTDTDAWATQVGLDLASGRNFAVGGATAASNPVRSDFAEQRTDFALAAPNLPNYTQAVVWFGGNDLLALLSNPALDPGIIIGSAVSSIALGIQDLAFNSNIDRFVVPGLPDFSMIPAGFGSSDAQAASLGFNTALQGAINALSNPLNPNRIDVRYVDVVAASAQALADPAFALGLPPQTCNQGSDCTGLVFWDGIHPTGAAHAFIAEAIAVELAPIPLPAGGALMLAGVFAFGTLRLRQRASA